MPPPCMTCMNEEAAFCSLCGFPDAESGGGNCGVPPGAHPETDMFKRDHNDRKLRREESELTHSRGIYCMCCRS